MQRPGVTAATRVSPNRLAGVAASNRRIVARGVAASAHCLGAAPRVFRYSSAVALALGGSPEPDVPPKAAVLSRLCAAGLPVPPGLVLAPAELGDPAVRSRIAELLRYGFVIVRAALASEDAAEAAGAGLGLSIADCSDLAAVDRAAARIADAAGDPWLVRYAGATPSYHLLVQRQVARRWLVVLAVDRAGDCVELHDARDFDALAAGATPAFSGPLALAPYADRLAELLKNVSEVMSEAPGLDLELVVDPDDRLWLVQARPLTRPLTPGWDEFRAALPAELDLPGLWRLDAEHNPAPLSPAHAGVIDRLAARGAPLLVLAGWLYEQVTLDRPRRPAPDPALALARLRDIELPAARRVLAEFDAELAARGPDASLLERALVHLEHTLAVHTAVRADLPAELPVDPADPLSLRERHAYLDVLPVAWDIASPTLAQMFGKTCPKKHVSENMSSDPAAVAVLARELDDHLFALGLAPLRRVYLAAGARLGLGDDVFLLTPSELADGFAGGALPDLGARRALVARNSALQPPLTLFAGRPVPVPPRGRLRGLPFGPSVRGRIARRRDLADLLARPPGPEDIIVLPALTAQAAVALQALAVRAVCCEHGGALSHAALMVRELGLSALVGCTGCTGLPDGLPVELDTRTGRLRPLAPEPPGT